MQGSKGPTIQRSKGPKVWSVGSNGPSRSKHQSPPHAPLLVVSRVCYFCGDLTYLPRSVFLLAIWRVQCSADQTKPTLTVHTLCRRRPTVPLAHSRPLGLVVPVLMRLPTTIFLARLDKRQLVPSNFDFPGLEVFSQQVAKCWEACGNNTAA